MSLKEVRKVLEPYRKVWDGVFEIGDYIAIPTKKSVYFCVDISCSSGRAVTIGKEYKRVEENAYESGSSALIIMGKRACELTGEWRRLTHESFLKELSGAKK